MSTLNYSLIVASSNSRKFHHYISRLSQWKLMKLHQPTEPVETNEEKFDRLKDLGNQMVKKVRVDMLVY